MIEYYAECETAGKWIYNDDVLAEVKKRGWDIYAEEEYERRKLSAEEVEQLVTVKPALKQEKEAYTREEVLTMVSDVLGGESNG